MSAFLMSTLVVALAEIGDKTMLLAILLSARFRKPLPILVALFFATLVNHTVAAFIGDRVEGLIDIPIVRYAVALSFIAIGLWIAIPDRVDETHGKLKQRGNLFLTALGAFFLVEFGDKTQLATLALAAQYRDVVAVTAGSTLGLMLVNIPAVLLGERINRVISFANARRLASITFIALGLWELARLIGWVG